MAGIGRGLLVTVLEILDDEAEALDSFSRAGFAGRNQESRRWASA